MRLLLVEDHVPLADQLMASLTRQGYAVDWLADGRDALYQGKSEPYDLIILDLGLPGLSGIEVLKQWRSEGLSIPVLILTARKRLKRWTAGPMITSPNPSGFRSFWRGFGRCYVTHRQAKPSMRHCRSAR